MFTPRQPSPPPSLGGPPLALKMRYYAEWYAGPAQETGGRYQDGAGGGGGGGEAGEGGGGK